MREILIAALLLYVPELDQEVLVVPSTERARVPDVFVERLPILESEEDAAGVQVAVIRSLWDLGYDVRSANVMAGAGERFVPLPKLLPPIEPPPKRPTEKPSGEVPAARMKSGAGGSPVLRGVGAPGQVAGFLSGKSIYVSAGHGWTWYDNLKRWGTQRPNTHDIVEDFVNAEAITHYFVPMLMNAGATVFPVREPDRNPNMIIADETAAVVTGEWQSGPAGWDPAISTMKSGVNPFATGGTIETTTAAETTATATFQATLPEDGHYGVSLAYAALEDRSPDAHVAVHHAGGVTSFQVDQRRHGSTWVYLGRFPFHAGPAVVVFSNESDVPGKTLSVDAVRFGGGMGVIERGTGSYPAAGPTTGRPRWESNCRYNAQFHGAPETVYDYSTTDGNDDVGSRSRYSAWQHEDGEDAVFVSWHTNAPSPGRGTSTWVYGPNEPNGQYIFTGTEGSDDLAEAVHEEVIDAIRAEWDPAWKDRGIFSAWFGELNPSHNPEMPATLIEMAFHDTKADAEYLAEPRFRETLARGYYRGIVRYFAERDGVEPQYLPLAPMHLRVNGQPDGTVSVAWEASDGPSAPASAYRVWTSPGGLGFGVAAVTGETSAVLEDVAPGAPLYVYVTATNPGGESFPSATLGVLPSCNPAADRALVVQGFTRLDAFSLPTEDMTPWSLGHPMRLNQDVVNTFDYAVEHGAALAAAGVPFDSAEATAVKAGLQPLAGYVMVDWILGEQSTVDETFDAGTQPMVAAYLDAGGRLFASGAELLWDLDQEGSAADKAFCEGYLGALFSSDDAGTKELANGVSFTEQYDVAFPDVLEPAGGAEVLWAYATGAPAAVHLSGAFEVVTAGFPFETIAGAADRAAMMAEVLDALGVAAKADLCVVPPPPDGEGSSVEPEPGVEPPPEDAPAPDSPPAPDNPTAPDNPRMPESGPAPDGGAVDPDVAPETDAESSAGTGDVVAKVKGIADTSDAGCSASGSAPVPPWLLLGLAAAALLGAARRRRASRSEPGA